MRYFKQNQIPNLNFTKAIKKPIPIKCFQIDKEFEVQTLEGIMKGKKGDWLMVGISGEMYPCDKTIFKKTYNLLK